jgi:hypothetical protein
MPYSASDVRKRDRILRVLLCGPAKAGKTTSAVLTSPQPVYVFNTDGKGALDPVAAMGGEFLADDIKCAADVTKGLAYVRAHQKDISTVVFDNLTIFWAIVENEVRSQVRDDPRVIFPEAGRRFMAFFHELVNLPCNVILIGHLEPGENNTPGGFGHVLGISGKSKTQISAIIQDWIWTEVSPDANGKMKWEFLLAPQGNWNKGVRSIQGVKRMPANITKFIELAEAQSKKTVTRAVESRIIAVDEEDEGFEEAQEAAARIAAEVSKLKQPNAPRHIMASAVKPDVSNGEPAKKPMYKPKPMAQSVKR